jgi:hypothetical protein
MPALPTRLAFAALACIAAATVAPARAAPDPAAAAALFEQAQARCDADGGALWGRPLCGPILLVDPLDRALIANQADAGGAPAPRDGVFVGTLPAGAMLANTRVEWSGQAWTQLLWPLPMEPALLRVFVVHALFHRVQPDLGLARSEPATGIWTASKDATCCSWSGAPWRGR